MVRIVILGLVAHASVHALVCLSYLACKRVCAREGRGLWAARGSLAPDGFALCHARTLPRALQHRRKLTVGVGWPIIGRHQIM